MKKIGFFLILALIGCSPNPQINFEKTSKEVESLTIDITRTMTDGRETEAYNSLMHEAVREKVSVETFQEIGGKLSERLGKFKSLQINRLDIDSTNQGLMARGMYIGTFEKGKGDVAVICSTCR